MSIYLVPSGRRYVLRMDGFVSLNAGYGGGEMVTKVLEFTGSELILNYSTSAAGSIRVEMQSPDGRALPNFSLADCLPVVGDEIEGVVRWRHGNDVSTLSGQRVRLRFVLCDADMYSMRFRRSSKCESPEYLQSLGEPR